MNLAVIKAFAIREMPSILVGFGLAGIVATAFESGKASVKASHILEEMEYTSQSPPTRKEKLKAVLPTYIPTMILGAMTFACIIGSNSVSLKRQAALASAYSIGREALLDYENKTVDIFGKNKAEKIKNEIAKDKVKSNPPTDKTIIDTGRGATIFRDVVTGGDFKSDIEYIKSVFNKLNAQLNDYDYVTLNDLRWELGLPQIKIGDDLGWNGGNQIEWIFSPIEVDREVATDGATATEEDIEAMKVIAIRYNLPGLIPDA